MFSLKDFAEPGDTVHDFTTGERYVVPEDPEDAEEYYLAESEARDILAGADLGIDFADGDAPVDLTVNELLAFVTALVLDK